jgi:anti-sigma factor RsiW
MSGRHVHGGPECRALFEKLSEYLDGELDPAVCAGMEEHLADCARCQAFLESLRRAVAHVGAAPPPELPEDVKNEVLAAYHRARHDGQS